MSVDPMIQAKTNDVNRARLRRGSAFNAAGRPNIKGSATMACSREVVGFHSQSPAYRKLYRDNRAQLPPGHFFAKSNPLLVGPDPRRPYSAPSTTPYMLRYAETLRNAESPPPRIRMHVPSRGARSDPAAGVPGPRSAMALQNGAGPSTPANLSKMRGNFRCRIPFREGMNTRPESAPLMTPGVPRTSVPIGYMGFQPGLTTAAGYSKATVMMKNGIWKTPSRVYPPPTLARPSTATAAARTCSNVA